MSLHMYFDRDWHEIQKLLGYSLLPIILIALILRQLSRPKLNLPRGPIGLPLVGYLPFLGKEPFRVLDRLSKKYGNVFSLYLGRTYIVFLGDVAAVKEAFSKTSTLGRPHGLFDFLPDGGGLSGVSGFEWVEQRRFTMRSMRDIGLGRSKWGSLVEDEVSDFIEVISNKKGDPIDINCLLLSSIANNISSLVFGERIPPGPNRDKLNSALDTIMMFFSQSSMWNYYPWLCDILVKLKISSYYKSYCEMSAFNKVIRQQIESHWKSQDGSTRIDFINEFISAIKTNRDKGTETSFNERNLIGTTQSLYVAGSDTSRTSLMWLFLAMAAYPEMQDKVHCELNSTAGGEQRPSWEDRSKFPYTYAVIMEGQRWKTIAPLNTLRIATEDVNVCGYDIPKGSTIIANNWGVHNDTNYWSEPEKFKPERFLQNGGKEVNFKPESYLPFSYGKRKCPGETVALMEIFLYFSTMMQHFAIRAPAGAKVSFEGVLGVTYNPVPQKLCFIPRMNCDKKPDIVP